MVKLKFIWIIGPISIFALILWAIYRSATGASQLELTGIGFSILIVVFVLLGIAYISATHKAIGADLQRIKNKFRKAFFLWAAISAIYLILKAGIFLARK